MGSEGPQQGPRGCPWGKRLTHLAKLCDALRGPSTPREEHDAPARPGFRTEIRAPVAVDDFYNAVRELLPAFALVRTGGVRAHGQARVEHQHASLCPRCKVPARGVREKMRCNTAISARVTGAQQEKKGGEGGGEVSKGEYGIHPCFGGTKSSYSALISA